MDVLAFIASPFAASTCPPRLKAAMTARLLDARLLDARLLDARLVDESDPAARTEGPLDHEPAPHSVTTTSALSGAISGRS